MESNWVVRKKRSARASISTNNHKHMAAKDDDMFKMLPKDLHIEIMNRLDDDKDLSIAMCVSKPWRKLILNWCVPSSQSLSIRFTNPVARMENEEPINSNLSYLVNNIIPFPFRDINHLFKWCSKVMCCKVKSKHFICSSNGLFLFHHNYKGHHYYVINPVTKQCVSVVLPEPCTTTPCSLATLAYDPSESRYFKIVRVHGSHNCVKVFSSETGCWTSLSFELPQKVLSEATWIKNIVYSKGAIFWLSTQGHMIKLHLDVKESTKNQAEMVELPPGCCDASKMNISLFNGHVLCVLLGEYLTMWMFLDGFDEVGEWFRTHYYHITAFKEVVNNREGKFIAIHPYYGLLFYKIGKEILCYFYCYDIVGDITIAEHPELYRYLKMDGFPFLECSTTFACCLDKEHPRLFQRLPIPEVCREVENYI